MTQRNWVYKADPIAIPDRDDDVIYAVRALRAGLANEGQQKLVCEWLQYVCGRDDWAFRKGEDGQRETDLVLGKQWVWNQFNMLSHPLLTPKARDGSVPPTMFAKDRKKWKGRKR